MEPQKVSKNQLKYLQSLKLRKYRQKYGRYLIEGRKVVNDILRDKPQVFSKIYAVDSWIGAHADALDRLTIPYQEIRPVDLDRVSSFVTGDQVMGECKMPTEDWQEPRGWVLYLDGLKDPGNVGTMLRTAEWFGIAQVVLSPGCVDLYNPKTLQASMGSAVRVPCYRFAFRDLQARLPRHRWFLAVPGNADSDLMTKPDQAGVLVIGGESHGISEELMHAGHEYVTIRRRGSDSVESLNAAVAAGILMHHLVGVAAYDS